MQYSKSLTEFKEIYETWDFYEFYELQALRLAIDVNKVYEPKPIQVALKSNLKR